MKGVVLSGQNVITSMITKAKYRAFAGAGTRWKNPLCLKYPTTGVASNSIATSTITVGTTTGSSGLKTRK